MKVFVIRSSEHFVGEETTVEAVRSSLEKAKAYVRSRGEVREWRAGIAGGVMVACADVWVGSRRDGSEYFYSISEFDME